MFTIAISLAISLRFINIINTLWQPLYTYVWNLTLHLKNTNSGKDHTLFMHLFYQYQFLQNGQFYHNMPFLIYTKTYLLLLLLGN